MELGEETNLYNPSPKRDSVLSTRWHSIGGEKVRTVTTPSPCIACPEHDGKGIDDYKSGKKTTGAPYHNIPPKNDGNSLKTLPSVTDHENLDSGLGLPPQSSIRKPGLCAAWIARPTK